MSRSENFKEMISFITEYETFQISDERREEIRHLALPIFKRLSKHEKDMLRDYEYQMMLLAGDLDD